MKVKRKDSPNRRTLTGRDTAHMTELSELRG